MIIPFKYAFVVLWCKLFVLIMRHRLIEIDQAKFYAISKIFKPRNIHELKILQGKLPYLREII